MNIGNMLSGLSGAVLWLLKWVLIFVGAMLAFVFAVLIVNYLIMRFIKKDDYVSILPKHPTFKMSNSNVIKNFFIVWPRQILRDNANPDRNLKFPFGTICFCGKKGSGKTMGSVKYMHELLATFPDVEFAGNVTIKDPELLKRYTYTDTVQKLFLVKNSKNKILEDGTEIIYPMCKVIDEASLSIKSNRFGGKKDEEVNEELLGAIANQRKEKEVYLYTVQRFHRGNKKLREQVDRVYKCFNIAGWMWCFPYVLDDNKSQDNTVELVRVRGCYNYVQTQKLRDSYDTRELIQDMVEGGLKSDAVIIEEKE